MRILYIEPFDAGSHAAFGRWLREGIDADWTSCTMPGRHWKWRMRGAAAWLAERHRAELERGFDLLFASSFLPLAELVGLVPSLSRTPRVLYFHENQLAFPVRREHVGGPDHHYGFTQMVSCLAADAVAFNSAYNRDTFVDGAAALLRRMPDAVPSGWVETIRARAHVLPLPIRFAEPPAGPDTASDRRAGPLIVWNHRWEHDKDPEAFFGAMTALADEGRAFRLAVCGTRFGVAPDVFDAARRALGERIVHFGPLERVAYERLLGEADLCVSTARHEFFGVAVLEAMHCGVRPLVPDRLAYRETVPAEFRYSAPPGRDELLPRLRACCDEYARAGTLRADHTEWTTRFSAERVLPQYRALFEALAARERGS